MRVRGRVEYLGTRFAGWQAQPNRPTVQVALEEAIRIATGASVRVDAAGRTDAGVHACGQIIAFDVPDATDLYKLRGALNGLTPPDLSIVTLDRADDDFDPRRNARSRTYRYTVVCGRPPAPLLADRSWHVYPQLDFAVLERLAATVVGTHDFRAFRAADCESASTIRHVFESEWTKRSYRSREGDVLVYEIRGNAFLKHMVRILVGSMVDVALGKLEEATFVRLIETGGKRTEAGRTAPARGLVLVRVDY